MRMYHGSRYMLEADDWWAGEAGMAPRLNTSNSSTSAVLGSSALGGQHSPSMVEWLNG